MVCAGPWGPTSASYHATDLMGESRGEILSESICFGDGESLTNWHVRWDAALRRRSRDPTMPRAMRRV